MNNAPSVIVFDVNETLSDMSPMGARFAEVGAPAPLAKLMQAWSHDAATGKSGAQRGRLMRGCPVQGITTLPWFGA